MRKAIQKAALAGLVFGSASAVFGGTIRHDLTHTPYLGLGDQIEYRSTGAVYVSYDLGWGLTFSSTLASGVLIAPNWVLTAAHVVDALKSDASATYMGFVPGEQDPNVGSPLLTPPGSPYHEMDLTYSVSHPSWTAARDEWLTSHPGDENGANSYALTKGYDIGLIYLPTPVTGITPAIRYAGSAEVGKTGTFVGYGMRGTGLTGSMMSDELRRAGNNVLDMVGGTDPFAVLSDRILLADFDDPGDADGVNLMGSATLLPLEYSIAPGDSGGPVFVDFPDDGLGPILVGINSFNGAFGPEDTPPGDGDPNAEYGEFMGATRVGPFNDWIDAHMATVPEPGALGVLMVAGVLALRRRRSSR